MNYAKKLKELIKRDGIAVLPGGYDGLSMRMIQHMGYEAAYLSGGVAHATLLGTPDMDLLSFTEMLEHWKRLIKTVNMPTIADVQEGFGGVHNMVRTVKLYEDAGIAGIQIDDEMSPSRCPFIDGPKTPLVSIETMCEKVEAACKARQNPDTMIIVRSDTRGSVYDIGGKAHLEEQIKRLNAYVKAGADCVFPVAETYADYKMVLDSVDAPYKLCCISAQLNDMPQYDLHKHTPEEYHRDMGCNIMIMPLLLSTSATKAMIDTMTYFKETGLQPGNDQMSLFSEYNKMLAKDFTYINEGETLLL